MSPEDRAAELRAKAEKFVLRHRGVTLTDEALSDALASLLVSVDGEARERLEAVTLERDQLRREADDHDAVARERDTAIRERDEALSQRDRLRGVIETQMHPDLEALRARAEAAEKELALCKETLRQEQASLPHQEEVARLNAMARTVNERDAARAAAATSLQESRDLAARVGVLEGALREAVAFIEPLAEEQGSYGHFHGGDPRKFTPDEECSTEAERAQWKADCEAWERGEGIDRGGPHELLVRDGEVVGHVTKSGYGLGVQMFADPEAVALLGLARTALSSPGTAHTTNNKENEHDSESEVRSGRSSENQTGRLDGAPVGGDERQRREQAVLEVDAERPHRDADGERDGGGAVRARGGVLPGLLAGEGPTADDVARDLAAARERVKHLAAAEREGENIGDLHTMVLRASPGTAQAPRPPKKGDVWASSSGTEWEFDGTRVGGEWRCDMVSRSGTPGPRRSWPDISFTNGALRFVRSATPGTAQASPPVPGGDSDFGSLPPCHPAEAEGGDGGADAVLLAAGFHRAAWAHPETHAHIWNHATGATGGGGGYYLTFIDKDKNKTVSLDELRRLFPPTPSPAIPPTSGPVSQGGGSAVRHRCKYNCACGKPCSIDRYAGASKHLCSDHAPEPSGTPEPTTCGTCGGDGKVAKPYTFGVMTCPACGGDGKRESEGTTCAACHQRRPDAWAYCAYCGAQETAPPAPERIEQPCGGLCNPTRQDPEGRPCQREWGHRGACSTDAGTGRAK